MGSMARGVSAPVLVVLLLALGSGQAHAAGYDFTVDPNPPNVGQVASFQLDGSTQDVKEVKWDLDGDSQGVFETTSTTPSEPVTHTYVSRGPAMVRMRVTENDDDKFDVERTITVNGPPTVDFGFQPANPLIGQQLVFSPVVTDTEADLVTLDWNFGDGATATVAAGNVTHTYPGAGTYTVVLTATDEHGLFSSQPRDVTVLSPPLPVPQRTPLALMRPFPVVRISGTVLPQGTLVRVLSVRAPQGARVRVRCRGSGCPVRTIARTSATRLVRFHRFERRFSAGTRLRIFVRQAGVIGKYTRFLIRAGKPPARVDRCLLPGRSRPVSCG